MQYFDACRQASKGVRVDADDGLGHLADLRMALMRATRVIKAESSAGGLTPTQTSVLSAARYHGPLRTTELAAREGLNPTLLSRILAELVQRGLVTREADPNDGRAALITATPAGCALFEDVQRERAEALRGRVARLSPTEREALWAAVPALFALASDPDSDDTAHEQRPSLPRRETSAT